jgi:hypothetical protein
MHPFAVSFPTLAVSAIYLAWQAYHAARLHHEHLLRDRLLRERVACLLWSAAHVPDARSRGRARRCGASEPTPLWPLRCPLLMLRARRRA